MLTRANLNADPLGAPYPLVAVYLGDTLNAGSTSSVLGQDVRQAGTATMVTSSVNPSNLGQTVTFTAKVTSATVTPTGPVTFSMGSAVLGTVSLRGGIASLTTGALPVGSAKVTATYSGNSNVGKSAASLVQTVR